MNLFSSELPGELTAFLTIVAGVVLTLMGLAMLINSGWRKSFSFWWGLFMLSDATIYFALAVVTLINGRPTMLWGVAMVGMNAVLGVIAFRAWAREKVS